MVQQGRDIFSHRNTTWLFVKEACVIHQGSWNWSTSPLVRWRRACQVYSQTMSPWLADHSRPQWHIYNIIRDSDHSPRDECHPHLAMRATSPCRQPRHEGSLAMRAASPWGRPRHEGSLAMMAASPWGQPRHDVSLAMWDAGRSWLLLLFTLALT